MSYLHKSSMYSQVWQYLLNPPSKYLPRSINLFMAVPTIYAKLIESFEQKYQRGRRTRKAREYAKAVCSTKIRWVYNKNLCAWLLWHWSSRVQLALCNPRGRVGSKFNWPSEDQCQRSHSKWVFVFIPHLKSKYSQLIVSKLPRKSAICPRRSPWRLIVLVRFLRSARLDTAWLVKSVTYFNLIGQIGGCVHEFQRSKYKFSSHPKTLELTG